MEFSEEEANKLNTGIYEGIYTPLNLPVSLYNAYTNEFIRAIEKGTGIDYSAIQYGVVPEDLALAMSENVYLFSGAKTFNYVLSTEDIIYNKEKVIPFKEFQEKAFANFNLYNKEWLRTEYETALKQSSHVKDWQDFEANVDIFPLLEYRTVGDVNVSLECRMKNGMILPVGDPRWYKYKPMTHYGCRCELHPLQRNEKPITGIPTGLKDNQVGFTGDIKNTGQLFDKSHPYFDTPVGYKRYAKRNFDLETP